MTPGDAGRFATVAIVAAVAIGWAAKRVRRWMERLDRERSRIAFLDRVDEFGTLMSVSGLDGEFFGIPPVAIDRDSFDGAHVAPPVPTWLHEPSTAFRALGMPCPAGWTTVSVDWPDLGRYGELWHVPPGHPLAGPK